MLNSVEIVNDTVIDPNVINSVTHYHGKTRDQVVQVLSPIFTNVNVWEDLEEAGMSLVYYKPFKGIRTEFVIKKYNNYYVITVAPQGDSALIPGLPGGDLGTPPVLEPALILTNSNGTNTFPYAISIGSVDNVMYNEGGVEDLQNSTVTFGDVYSLVFSETQDASGTPATLVTLNQPMGTPLAIWFNNSKMGLIAAARNDADKSTYPTDFDRVSGAMGVQMEGYAL